MLEVGGILQVAERGYAVPFGVGLVLAACWTKRRAGQRRAGANDQQVPPSRRVHPRSFDQLRPPVLAAFSASHHHSEGRPATPYFGSGSAWLKRSQRA